MTRLPDVADDVEVADFADELVVLVVASRRAIRLPTGPALVFDACRRQMAVDDVLPELTSALGVDEEAAAEWLADTLVELARQGLLAPIDGDISGGAALG